jgi:cytochrome P450
MTERGATTGRTADTSTPAPRTVVLGSPEFAADPPAQYAWLREHAPVHRGRIVALTDQDVWLVSRYEDVTSLLTDDRFLRAPQGESALTAAVPEHVRLFTTESLIYKDDPEHRRLRRLVVKPFTPKAVASLGARVGTIAHALLDDLERWDGVDLRNDFALPIPTTVIAEMVGVDEADRDRFLAGMQAAFGGLSADHGEQAWDEDVKGVIDLVRDLVARRRVEPRDDILTGLVHAEEEGDQLSDDELVAMVFTLVSAGYETTYSLITNAVVTLLDHPDQLGRLRTTPADDALWRSAVEEIVRYTGTVASTEAITAAEDVTWHGETIPAGAIVFPVLGAANRDPAAFEDPERFDITRHPNNHLGFGHGVHFCLGANLARMETRVALQVLLERSPHLRLAVDRADIGIEPVFGVTRYREVPAYLG